MYCPDCGEKLASVTARSKDDKDITVEYCPSCGGYFLDHWEANKISLKSARELERIFSKHLKLELRTLNTKCPHCNITLQDLRGENVPANCQVLYCSQCGGNWFPSGELTVFKKAQESKLSYLKTWGIPITSAFSVLLPVLFIVIVGASIPITVYLTQKNQEQRTIASELIKNRNIYFLDSGEVLIAWNTSEALPSELEYGTNPLFLEKITVSVVPQTFHQARLSDIKKDTTYYYKIIIHKDGKAITSPQFSFVKK